MSDPGLYDQFTASNASSVSPQPGGNAAGWDAQIYQANIPSDPYSPDPGQQQIPFWDLPSLGLDPANNPLTQSAWDVIAFNLQPFPGLARVSGRRTKNIDAKMAKGSASPTLTYVGDRPSEFEVTLSIWNRVQFNQLQSLMGIIMPKPGLNIDDASQAVDVDYPSLRLVGISACIIVGIDLPRPGSPKGVWDLKIHCLEWRPKLPQDVTVTPDHATSIFGNGAIQDSSSAPKPSKTDVGTNP